MLNADNGSCLRGERWLITALSFTVQRGRLLAVTGENESGKSSSPRSVEARRMSRPGMLPHCVKSSGGTHCRLWDADRME